MPEMTIFLSLHRQLDIFVHLNSFKILFQSYTLIFTNFLH